MIRIANISGPEWQLDEVLRYARAKSDDLAAIELARECMAEAEPELSYRVCYRAENIFRVGSDIRFCGLSIDSDTLRRSADGCSEILIFAATVGAQFDRLIQRYSRLSPSKAVMLQAIGAERVEALCDAFSDSFCSENDCILNRRVSPGYGDLSLSLQNDIFGILDCPRKIGLTLNSSLLMSPSKSVTAFAGIKRGII